jgi:hypothetical protein
MLWPFKTLLARNNGQYAADDPLKDWWSSLNNAQGGNCCSGADGRRVAVPDWEKTGDPEFPYRVNIDGEWVRVSRHNVVEATNRVGYPVVWPVTEEGGHPYARCFMPGAFS